MFATLQDRLVKELDHAGLRDVDTANRWIRESYLPRHNARFAKPAALPEKAFVAVDPELLRETLCSVKDGKTAVRIVSHLDARLDVMSPRRSAS